MVWRLMRRHVAYFGDCFGHVQSAGRSCHSAAWRDKTPKVQTARLAAANDFNQRRAEIVFASCTSHLQMPRMRSAVDGKCGSERAAASPSVTAPAAWRSPRSAARLRRSSSRPWGSPPKLAVISFHSVPILLSHSLNDGRSTSSNSGQLDIDCGDSHG